MGITAYLAGPMAGIKDHNYPKFDLYARYIRDQLKYKLLSPHEFGFEKLFEDKSRDVSATYEFVLQRCLSMVGEANIIFMMDGWTRSRGALAEFDRAAHRQIPIYYMKMHETPGGLTYFDHTYIG